MDVLKKKNQKQHQKCLSTIGIKPMVIVNDIPVENHLQSPIKQKILALIFIQISLKATLKSKAFETFTPQRFSLYNDGNVLIASLRFLFLDQNDRDQEEILEYLFDVYGNVFNVLNKGEAP